MLFSCCNCGKLGLVWRWIFTWLVFSKTVKIRYCDNICVCLWCRCMLARVWVLAISLLLVNCFAGSVVSDIVDIFDGLAWSSARLSTPRLFLSATTVGVLVIFAGGATEISEFKTQSAGASDAVDIFNSTDMTWATARLSVARFSGVATGLAGIALFSGGWNGTDTGVYSTVDIFCVSSTSPACLPDTPNSTIAPSTPPVTSQPAPASVTVPSRTSPIPTWITVAAVATSGHFPRALELVQFLSIYCTSLSSRQQTRVNEFQVVSFTYISASKMGYCDVCPGSCTRPLVVLVPTFALICFCFALSVCVAAFDAFNAHNPDRLTSPAQDRLLETSAASVDESASMRRVITVFCARYIRGLIETCSAYVMMPCTFVFVLNVRPSSFAQADSSDRAMIVMLPVLMILFRALVIHQRLVHLTLADQRQLYFSSACSCLITAVLGASFAQFGEARELAPSFASDTAPQCIVLALLVVQIIAQTAIRFRATEASIFDKMDGPWSSSSSHAPSAVFSFDELPNRLAIGSMKRASSSAVIEFFSVKLCGHFADWHGHRWPRVCTHIICLQYRNFKRCHRRHPAHHKRRAAAVQYVQAREAVVAKVLQQTEAVIGSRRSNSGRFYQFRSDDLSAAGMGMLLLIV
jgi:hypothetical protein